MTLHDELERIASHAPVVDPRDDTWARARRARRRDLGLTIAGVAAVLALVAGAVAWLPAHLDPPVADTDGAGVPDHLYGVPERMSARENDGSWMRDEVTNDPTVVGVGAAAWVTREGLPVVVDAEQGGYHLLDLPDFAGNNPYFTRGLGTPVVALSPDGGELAYGYAVFGPDADTEPIPSGVRVVDLTTGTLREIPVPGREGTAVSQIDWSPGGTWLAFTGMQQDTWTTGTMGGGGPRRAVIGRVPPGATEARTRATGNDQVPLSIDDTGALSSGTISSGPDSLGQVDDDLRLVRASGELQLLTTDGSEAFTVGAVEPDVGDPLTVAVDLVTAQRPTVGRPEPDWPWSDTHRAVVVGLYAGLTVTFLIALRRVRRRPFR